MDHLADTESARAALPKAASAEDRDHFRRLGQWQRRNHERERATHLALSVAERLVESLMAAVVMMSADNWGRRDDVPLALYTKAKRLGLAKR